jgi:hypothetical protein
MNTKTTITGTTEAILEDMLERLPTIITRALGNSALTVGFSALCRALKSPEGAESKEEALRIAQSAAAWYKAAWDRHDTLPPRDQLYANPQTLEGFIDYIMQSEPKQENPSDELLEAIGVTREEYMEVAEEEERERRTWLEEHRAELEEKWNSIVAAVPYTRDIDVTSVQLGTGAQWGVASARIAEVLITKYYERIRKQRIKAFRRGWIDAVGELKLLSEYEKALVAAIKRERDDDLL